MKVLIGKSELSKLIYREHITSLNQLPSRGLGLAAGERRTELENIKWQPFESDE